MIIEFVLCAALVHDDVPSQLAVVTHLKALIRKLLTRLLRIYFLSNFEAAHHKLAYIRKLAGNHEQMVTLFNLAPQVRSTSSEARIAPR